MKQNYWLSPSVNFIVNDALVSSDRGHDSKIRSILRSFRAAIFLAIVHFFQDAV